MLFAQFLEVPDGKDFTFHLYKALFDVTFFIIITTIGLNIIFGIIVDTFSELRDNKVSYWYFLLFRCHVCERKENCLFFFDKLSTSCLSVIVHLWVEKYPVTANFNLSVLFAVECGQRYAFNLLHLLKKFLRFWTSGRGKFATKNCLIFEQSIKINFCIILTPAFKITMMLIWRIWQSIIIDILH